MVLPYGEGHDQGILVGLRTSELFVHRAGSFEPFAAAVYDRRADERLAGGAVLPDGSFAIATRLRRALLDRRSAGKTAAARSNRAAGLQDNYVHAVLPDRHGGVWLALQTGASRVAESRRPSRSSTKPRGSNRSGGRSPGTKAASTYKRIRRAVQRGPLVAPACATAADRDTAVSARRRGSKRRSRRCCGSAIACSSRR